MHTTFDVGKHNLFLNELDLKLLFLEKFLSRDKIRYLNLDSGMIED